MPQLKSDRIMLIAATYAMAWRPDTGSAASLRMSRAAGGEVATTWPPMATSAICIVKTMRLQKPSPKDLATACGLDPFSSAAPATTTTAMAPNTKPSGNQPPHHGEGREHEGVGKPALGPGGEAQAQAAQQPSIG